MSKRITAPRPPFCLRLDVGDEGLERRLRFGLCRGSDGQAKTAAQAYWLTADPERAVGVPVAVAFDKLRPTSTPPGALSLSIAAISCR